MKMFGKERKQAYEEKRMKKKEEKKNIQIEIVS